MEGEVEHAAAAAIEVDGSPVGGGAMLSAGLAPGEVL